MKKILLFVVAAGLAVAAQAGSDKANTASSCCAQMNSQTKAECPMMTKDGKGCCSAAKATKTACTKPVLKSPKALG